MDKGRKIIFTNFAYAYKNKILYQSYQHSTKKKSFSKFLKMSYLQIYGQTYKNCDYFVTKLHYKIVANRRNFNNFPVYMIFKRSKLYNKYHRADLFKF